MESKRKFTMGQNGMPQGNVGQDNYYYWRGVPQVRARVRRRGNSGASSSQLTRQEIFSAFSKLGKNVGGDFAKVMWADPGEGQTAYGIMQKSIYENYIKKIGDSGDIVDFTSDPLSYIQKNYVDYCKSRTFYNLVQGTTRPGVGYRAGTMDDYTFGLNAAVMPQLGSFSSLRVCCMCAILDNSDYGFSVSSFSVETGIIGEYVGQTFENVFALPIGSNGSVETIGTIELTPLNTSSRFDVTFKGLGSLSSYSGVYAGLMLVNTSNISYYNTNIINLSTL